MDLTKNVNIYEKFQESYLKKNSKQQLEKLHITYDKPYNNYHEKKCKRWIKMNIDNAINFYNIHVDNQNTCIKLGTFDEEVIDCWNKDKEMIQLFKIHKKKHQKIKKLNYIDKYNIN